MTNGSSAGDLFGSLATRFKDHLRILKLYMNELQVYCTRLVPKIGGPEVGWKIEGNSTVGVPLHGIFFLDAT